MDEALVDEAQFDTTDLKDEDYMAQCSQAYLHASPSKTNTRVDRGELTAHNLASSEQLLFSNAHTYSHTAPFVFSPSAFVILLPNSYSLI